jgi:predicted aspartyl protease
MATAYFTSLADAETVDVDFVHPEGGIVTMRLLVDSGFTGEGSVLLPRATAGLVQASVERMQATGALSGAQDCGLVKCCVADLAFDRMVTAIFSNLAPLCLPSGVDGMVGLTFLRYFERWGAERAPDKSWRFFLESGENNRP